MVIVLSNKTDPRREKKFIEIRYRGEWISALNRIWITSLIVYNSSCSKYTIRHSPLPPLVLAFLMIVFCWLLILRGLWDHCPVFPPLEMLVLLQLLPLDRIATDPGQQGQPQLLQVLHLRTSYVQSASLEEYHQLLGLHSSIFQQPKQCYARSVTVRPMPKRSPKSLFLNPQRSCSWALPENPNSSTSSRKTFQILLTRSSTAGIGQRRLATNMWIAWRFRKMLKQSKSLLEETTLHRAAWLL